MQRGGNGRKEGKKKELADRRATRRVSRLVTADSHPVNVPRTPKRLNGVTRSPAASLVRSFARSCGTHRGQTHRSRFRDDLHLVMTRHACDWSSSVDDIENGSIDPRRTVVRTRGVKSTRIYSPAPRFDAKHGRGGSIEGFPFTFQQERKETYNFLASVRIKTRSFLLPPPLSPLEKK